MDRDELNGAHPSNARPPLLERWILSRILPVPLKPTAAGDFEELYRRILAAEGRRRAAAWYRRQIRKSAPPIVLAAVTWRFSMIRSYLTLTVRNMIRRPGFTIVDIGGLSIGLAACILAFFFIREESSFNRFHPHVERIHEVRSAVQIKGGSEFYKETQGPVGPALTADFPEVEAATRLAAAEVVVQVEDQVFLQRVLGVDPSFFDIFDFPLIRGDAATALRTPASVILGQAAARRCFGSSDPLGRTISIKIGDETAYYLVEGVLRELPANSSLKFDGLLPIQGVKGPQIDQWGPGPDGTNVDAACFVRLREGVEAGALESKFPATLDRRPAIGGSTIRHYLFPFDEYHRGAREYVFSSVLEPRSSPAYSTLLAGIAVLILIIAGINFVNLCVGTAAAERVKEIGMRKVLGAGRKNLCRQFRFEGVVLSLAALAGGVGLASAILPVFNRFAVRSIRLDLLGQGIPLLILILLAVLLGMAAGSYPGWYLSRLRPLDLFRGTFFLGRRGGFSRALLAFQFAISIFLVITTAALDRQHRHLLRFDLGYQPEQVAVLDLRPLTPRFQASSQFFPVLKSRLLGHPGILSVSGAASGMSSWSARAVKHKDSGKIGMVRFNDVDPDFRETLGLQLSQGRWFSPDHPSDAAEAVVVNEAFVRFFSASSPVGRPLAEFFPNRSSQRIIGVVRDFHFDSLRRTVDPAMISLSEGQLRQAYIRLDGRDLRSAMDAIERDFKAVAPGYPFLFSFLDENVARQYASEARWSLMASVVSLLAVLIACVGVFALVVLSTVRKTKEIGVRKVLGASVSQIVGLLEREYVRLAAAAGILACPVAFLAVRKILNAYPYRIAIGPWLFLSGGLLVTILILATVSIQAVRAARANPVDSLRRE